VLTDDLAATYDPVYKVNPPLRTAADVEAVRAGLADGTIDVVATDHAPHPTEDKDCEWAAAAMGMLGLETALSVVIETMVDSKRLGWRDVAARMSTNPARIGRVEDHGAAIAVGQPANLCVVDANASWVVDPARLASRSRNTPYAERTMRGRVLATFLRGNATVLNGSLTR
jgi:dihydroorotase